MARLSIASLALLLGLQPLAHAQSQVGAFESCVLVISRFDSDGHVSQNQKALKLVSSEEGATIYRAKYKNKTLYFVHNRGQALATEKLTALEEILPSETGHASSVFILKDSTTGASASALSTEFSQNANEAEYYRNLVANTDSATTLFGAQDQLKMDFSGSSFDAKNRREFVETVVGADFNPESRNAILTEIKCPGAQTAETVPAHTETN